MTDPTLEIDLVVRGVTVGSAFAIGAGSWRQGAGWSERLATALFCAGLAAWDLSSSPVLWAALGHPYILLLPAFAAVGFFWLFVGVLFEDREISPATLAPAGILVILSVLAEVTPPPADQVVWGARDLIAGAIAIHAAVVILRSWGGDLVDARRRLRGPLLVAVTVFIVAEAFVGIGVRLGLGAEWYDFTGGGFIGACVLAIFSIAGSVVFLEGRPTLFQRARTTSLVGDAPPLNGADPITLERLKRLMETDEAWRRQGLTIGAVAEDIGVPEYRLRRLINDHLGYRNFADFLNTYRIASAKAQLSALAPGRTTVAGIAFDLGYGSLGPFNRAFKADTGVTPTEWRNRTAGPMSPDLEKAG